MADAGGEGQEDCWQDIEVEGIGGKKVGSYLDVPTDLLVRIMQRIPFPLCFKARLLDREWRSKFQGRFSPVISTWPTYCPAFLWPGGKLVGFNKLESSWRTMRFDCINQLDRRNTYGVFGPAPSGVLDGALHCTLSSSPEGLKATVLNLINGNRRVIACPLKGKCLPLFTTSGDNYEVLLLSQESERTKELEPKLKTYRYDSHAHSWSQNLLSPGRLGHLIRYLHHLGRLSFTYLDGFLYWYYKKAKSRTFQVYRICLHDGSEAESPHVTLDFEITQLELLKCGSRIFMLAAWQSGQHIQTGAGVSLYEVDKDSLHLKMISSCSRCLFPERLEFSAVLHAPLATGNHSDVDFKSAADDDSIYVCGQHVMSFHLESGLWYNLGPVPVDGQRRNDWQSKLWKIQCVKFDPGLNPFAVP